MIRASEDGETECQRDRETKAWTQSEYSKERRGVQTFRETEAECQRWRGTETQSIRKTEAVHGYRVLETLFYSYRVQHRRRGWRQSQTVPERWSCLLRCFLLLQNCLFCGLLCSSGGGSSLSVCFSLFRFDTVFLRLFLSNFLILQSPISS